MSFQLEKDIIHSFFRLTSPREIKKFDLMLNAEHFKNMTTSSIVKKIHEVVANNIFPDQTTIRELFPENSEEGNLIDNLSKTFLMTTAGLEGYIYQLKEQYIQNEGLRLLDLSKSKFNDENSISALGAIIADFKTLRDSSIEHSSIHTSVKIRQTMDEYKLIKDGVYNSIVPYCLSEIDKKVFVTKGQVHTISAQSGTGKTAFALSCMRKQIEKGIPVLLFCCESRSIEVLNRLACIISGATYLDIFYKFNRCPEKEEQYINALSWLNKHANRFQIFGLSEYHHSTKGIEERLIEAFNNNSYDIVYIDYLQSLRTSNSKPRHEQIEADMNEICRLAGEYDVAVTLLSQFNRTVAGEEPNLQHIKGSSSVENYSHICSFLAPKEKESQENNYTDFKFYSGKTRLQAAFKMELERWNNGEFRCKERREVY